MKVGELKINDKFLWRNQSVTVVDIQETANQRTLTLQFKDGSVSHPTFKKAFGVKMVDTQKELV